MTGHLENPYSIISSCDYGLLTSLREGFPNVILEMICCGVKNIVSTPCFGSIEKKYCIHITEGKAEKLAKIIKKMHNKEIISKSNNTIFEAHDPQYFIKELTHNIIPE